MMIKPKEGQTRLSTWKQNTLDVIVHKPCRGFLSSIPNVVSWRLLRTLKNPLKHFSTKDLLWLKTTEYNDKVTATSDSLNRIFFRDIGLFLWVG